MLNILSSMNSSMQRLLHQLPAQVSCPDKGESMSPDTDLAGGPFEIIADRRQIAHVLRGIAESRRPVVVSSQHLAGSAKTRLLAIDPQNGQLLIRQLSDETQHAIMIADGHINFVSRHIDSPALCSIDIAGLGECNGTPCYVAPLPQWLLFSQMRDSLRIRVAESRNAVVRYAFADKEIVEARVINVSAGGVGLLIPHLPLRRVSVHDKWRRSMLRWDVAEIGPLNLAIRHVDTTITGQQRIGAMIENATEGVHQRLRLLIMRHQATATRSALS